MERLHCSHCDQYFSLSARVTWCPNSSTGGHTVRLVEILELPPGMRGSEPEPEPEPGQRRAQRRRRRADATSGGQRERWSK